MKLKHSGGSVIEGGADAMRKAMNLSSAFEPADLNTAMWLIEELRTNINVMSCDTDGLRDALIALSEERDHLRNRVRVLEDRESVAKAFESIPVQERRGWSLDVYARQRQELLEHV